jgi:hypothetical protein
MSLSRKNMDKYSSQAEVLYNTLATFKFKQNEVYNFGKIEKVSKYLAKNIRKRATINKNYTSYGLKHIIEYDLGYVSNGEIILSALLAGFRMDNTSSVNPCFNVNTTDVKFIAEKEVREKDVDKTQEEREFDSWYREITKNNV